VKIVAEAQLKIYRAAIVEKFPELTLKSIKYLSEGWDSVACRVNERLIFRFPKRAEVERTLLKEIGLLPELGPALPLPIPQFKYISEKPGQLFPFAFVGYEMIKGEQLENCSPEAQEADWWRRAVGDFLTALHAFPVKRAQAFGVEIFASTQEKSFQTWREWLEQFYLDSQAKIFPMLADKYQTAIGQEFENFLRNEANFQFEPVLIHGDLNEEHILLDPATQRVTGIIDFGDAGIGDPAYDVTEDILPYYKGKLDATWQQRRHFYRKLGPLQIMFYAKKAGDGALLEFGNYELERLWPT